MPIRLNIDAFKQTKLGQDSTNQEIVRREFAGEAAQSRQPAQSLGRVADPQREPDPRPPLVKNPPPRNRSKKRVVVLVEIIAFGPGEVDDDNIATGAKPLRDSIAHSLGVDDGDKRFRWRYRSVITDGSPGTLVRIQRIK